MLFIEPDDTVSLRVSDQAEFANYQTQNGIVQLAFEAAKQTHLQSINYLNKELFKSKKSAPTGNLADQLKRIKTISTLSSVEHKTWTNETILAALRLSCFPNGSHQVRDQTVFQDCFTPRRDTLGQYPPLKLKLNSQSC